MQQTKKSAILFLGGVNLISPFRNISPKNREKLLYALESSRLTFPKNQYILSSINRSNMIGIVINGFMQIIKTDYNGNRTIIEELQENDVFGTDLSPLTNIEYDIITKEESTIYIIDYDEIINFQTSNKEYYNQFIKNLLEIIILQIQEKNKRIEILTKKTIRHKLLEYFNIMTNDSLTRIIYLPFSFTDLADYLAIDRSAMSRELKNLKEEGFIEIKGRRITLLYDKY